MTDKEFSPKRCTAWEDCNHDGICHDKDCGAVGPNARTERVSVPVGLVEELMTWCNDELERAAQGTQFRADLIYFHDELLGAKEGY
jgi:hypothetical protein